MLLPTRLARLGDLAFNLWWCWNPDAVALFRDIAPARWRALESNPVALLETAGSERLAALASDAAFTSRVDAVAARLDAYLAEPAWFDRAHPGSSLRVAYFCAEFGVSEALPIYSGGLGILAGDHLKSASDLGVPLVAVGLAYHEGYHRQSIDEKGWQQERYPRNRFASMPMTLVRDDDGQPRVVHIELPDRALRAHIWLVRIGRVRLYLLDAEIPANAAADRALTARLYGGGSETRILQEILLGIGGIRALAAAGERPNVFHMNEGHSAFLGLERARAAARDGHLRWEEALASCRTSAVFTTHTPVPAGNDEFDADRVEWYLRPFREGARIPTRALVALGTATDDAVAARFSMTVLAMRTAAHRNGVSALHGAVSRSMWKHLWPELPEADVPIDSITNGVHAPTWIAAPLRELIERHAAKGFSRDPDAAAWRAIRAIPDEQLWLTHETLRGQLIDSLRARCKKLGIVPRLEPGVLTIGFARRFATYKRATLMLHDRARLTRILTDPSRPVQIVIAGKAHPMDEPAKTVLRDLLDASRDPALRGRILFIEDYEMSLARDMVSGCDVWLNTPRRPLEASGTSGMKAAMNGVLNLSVLDGWWDEGFAEDAGWAIGTRDAVADEVVQDASDAESLYRQIEDEVVPRFYARDGAAVPLAWVAMMKASMERLGAIFNTHRMVAEYTERAYLPALGSAIAAPGVRAATVL